MILSRLFTEQDMQRFGEGTPPCSEFMDVIRKYYYLVKNILDNLVQ